MLFSQKQVNEIRVQSQRMETEGAVTENVLQLIYKHKLFKLFVPRELGGRMASLPEAVRIFVECSRIDGSFGWLVNIGSGGGFFASLMESHVAHSVYMSPEAVIAGSGAPSGVAKRVDGGYIVNGSWKYCSGSTHATVFTANCIVEPEVDEQQGAQPEIRSFVLMPEQIEIHRDWNAFGLKATASHTIMTKEAFVPEERTFLLAELKGYGEEPVYQYPFLPFAQASFAAVSLGIAKHFLEEARELILLKKRDAHVLEKLERQEGLLKEREAMFLEAVEQSWNELLQDQQLTEASRQEVSAECLLTARTALACGLELFPFLGLSAAMQDSAVNRAWRDLQTACQHALLIPAE
ncbi:acyl-CoA dehydrogenase [Paenibacillus sp. N10]|uniref:Acyl-CoA dehydrogenase n=1 Tax=Paenibacillus lutrae TaxID=2078573 RepID=A0A7X3K187_9BACL|nr:acyl-CoA dehydrogenase [Paenibacillus lutrae]